MGLTKLILTIVITTAITISLTTRILSNVEEAPSVMQLSQDKTSKEKLEANLIAPQKKRVSRFLVQKMKPYRNNIAADHCKNNEEICQYQGGANSTMACCGNKCIALKNDNDNCGACTNQCKFTQTCCRGECVYLAYDKRHCGECNNPCQDGQYCVYGMCSYA